MRLLLIDPLGNALDFALRAQRDGNEVRHYIRQKEKTRYIGRGLVTIVEDYAPWMRWADVVFLADNTVYTHDMNTRWRQEGCNIFGPTLETAQWELDRTLGMQVFRRAGVTVPPSKEFVDYDKAIAYVKKRDARLVSKPCGNEEDKSLSYCAKTPEDMIYMLQRWKRTKKHKGSFVLQDFIPGIEMAVGGWYGPAGFNAGWCENFEFKKFANDDMGISTGEQGTVLQYVRRSKLAEKVLAPVADQLAKTNYTGYIDVNCIIDEKGQPWPLEFTTRPGWPTFCIQQALHKDGHDHVKWMHDLCCGIDAHNWMLDTPAIGVVVSIPDYPYSHATRKEVVGVPIYLDEKLWPNVHPCECMMGTAPDKINGSFVDRPMMVTAGDYVLVMSATGETVQTAMRTIYRSLKALIIPNSPMYRTDIGKRLREQLPELHRMGYATRMEFLTIPLRLSA